MTDGPGHGRVSRAELLSRQGREAMKEGSRHPPYRLHRLFHGALTLVGVPRPLLRQGPPIIPLLCHLLRKSVQARLPVVVEEDVLETPAPQRGEDELHQVLGILSSFRRCTCGRDRA